MRKGWSCINDSGDFSNESSKLGKMPDNAVLVIADVEVCTLAFLII